jgi:prolycopene isomerase
VSARTPTQSSRDVVVVGSGLGGLVTAALLAHAGRSVLVVERADGPGGCAHAFRRGPYLFDPAIHVTLDGGTGQFLDTLLSHLGVRDRCEFATTGHLYTTAFPGFTLEVPAGKSEFVDAHAAAFPGSAEEIRRFLEYREEFVGQLKQLPPKIGLTDLPLAMARFPLVFRHRNDTVDDVLPKYVEDAQARAVLTSVWPYQGLPPSRLSLLFYGQLLELLTQGAYYPLGSFQTLADAFVAALENAGGELLVGQEVRRIAVERGRARGVELADGSFVEAPIVVSNADLRHTVEDLVGVEHVPKGYWSKVRRLNPSLSGFVVYAATKADLSAYPLSHENFLYRHWDHDETLRDIEAGKPGGMWMNVPTLLDPSLAPDGEHLVIMSSLAKFDIGRPWEHERDRFTEEMIGSFDDAFTGLGAGLEVVETATPETLVRATRAQQGALYGWENTPAQSANKRPAHDSPVEGLYLCGQWTLEAGSSFRVMLSGVETARLLLKPTGESGPADEIAGSVEGTPAPVKFGSEESGSETS